MIEIEREYMRWKARMKGNMIVLFSIKTIESWLRKVDCTENGCFADSSGLSEIHEVGSREEVERILFFHFNMSMRAEYCHKANNHKCIEF
jgi:hypothetical protein